MQVHYGFDVENIGTDAINDGVRETIEIEFAIVALNSLNFMPAFGFNQDAAQRAFKFIKKVSAEARLSLLVPPCSSFQFFVGFRMADDVHEVWHESLEPFP